MRTGGTGWTNTTQITSVTMMWREKRRRNWGVNSGGETNNKKSKMDLVRTLKYIYEILPSEHYFPGRIVREFVKEHSKFEEGKLLDIGCGNSPFKKFFPNMNYTGIDKYIKREEVIRADAHNLPFIDDRFDVILCTEVIEHTEEPKKVLNEAKRVLKPEGKLILTAPQTWCLHYEPNDYYRYTKYGLKYIIEETGFDVEKTKQLGNLFHIIGSRLIDSFYETFDSLTQCKYTSIRFISKFVLRLFLTPFNLLNYYVGFVFPKRKDALCWGIIASGGNQ